jgi:hypothetical protein
MAIYQIKETALKPKSDGVQKCNPLTPAEMLVYINKTWGLCKKITSFNIIPVEEKE